MKITNVEVFPIYPPLAKRYRDNPARNGHEHRVAAKVTTDIGITGGGKGSNMLYLKGIETEKISTESIISKVVDLVEKKAEEIEKK